jgi:VanZ family protein
MQMSIKKLLVRKAIIIAILLTIAVAVLSLKPTGVQVKVSIKNFDKALHFIAYFILTLSWLFAFVNKKHTLLIIFLLIFYGIFLEYAQELFTEKREKDIFDMIANSVGVIIAATIFNYLYNNFVKKFG